MTVIFFFKAPFSKATRRKNYTSKEILPMRSVGVGWNFLDKCIFFNKIIQLSVQKDKG